jgi:putative OPT family oligopeptide transporter
MDEQRPEAPAPEGAPADERIYRPAPDERQLTIRAVGIGCLLGAVIATINIYFGLKTGWNIGGAILSAILAYATFAMLKPREPFTVLETNIAQTAASGAGTMVMAAGLVAPIPALRLMGHELSLGELYVWAASVAWIGVFFAVPLRRQMIVVERLRFPSATATAHTIVAMFGSGAETLRRARVLLRWAFVAAALFVAGWLVRPLREPPLHVWLSGSVFATLAAFTFRLYLDPMLMGAGILVGMRVSASLVAGAIVGWGVLGPWVQSNGWAPGPTMAYANGVRGWILWTGVAIMLADAVTSLALSWRTIAAVFRRAPRNGEEVEDRRRAIPNSWWLGGLALSTTAASVVLHSLFGIPPWMTVLAVLLSAVLAAIAVRSSGETDINPVSGVAKVTQFVFGAVAPGQVATNLLAAGVTGAGASQASDMMGDLKTGHLLGASPRKQFIAQVIAIAAGVLFCVPVSLMVTSGKFPNEDLPAPSADAWKATAELLSVGLSALPPNAQWGALAGVLLGIAVPLLRRFVPATAPYLPSTMAFGIAFIIPAYFAIPFLIGATAHAIWKRVRPAQAADLAFAVASGILVGAGLANVLDVVFQAVGLKPVVS